jgi:uncharacterized glyoxalase superfamily protein PhnB
MTPITPYLFYEDVGAAVAWLTEAFDFEETLRSTADDGTVTHAELAYDGDRLMLGRFSPGYQNPKRTGHVSQLVFVLVTSVDEHCRKAKEHGAVILDGPEDKPYGQRQYTAEDPEGHRWAFAEQVRDVLPEEWGAVQAAARTL